MDKEATLKAAEKAIDVVEPIVEEAEQVVEAASRIPKLWLNGTTKKQQILILGIVALGGAAAGAAAATVLVRRKLTLKYDALLRNELAEARAFYQRIHKPPMEDLAGRHATPAEKNIDSVVRTLEKYSGMETPKDEDDEQEFPVEGHPGITQKVSHNIFVEGKPMEVDDFDYDAEVPKRSEDHPYVISHDEFMLGEKDYVQTTLTYYEGDDTLVDDKNEPIPNSDYYVGDDNLQKFGHGSKDPRIVYVRNDIVENDFEVVKHTGAYSEIVLGFQHSDRPGSRKERRFRGDDG